MSHERSGWLSGDRIAGAGRNAASPRGLWETRPAPFRKSAGPGLNLCRLPRFGTVRARCQEVSASSAQLVIRKERIVMRPFTRLTFVAGAVLGLQLLSASAHAQIAISPWFVGGGYYGGGTADGNFMFGV